MSLENFKRIEKKFWLSEEQYQKVFKALEPYIELDAYGENIISNIYYDTDNFTLIRNSIERPVFKEKIRIRSYNMFKSDTPVFIELKRKYDGIGYKRRAEMNLAEAFALMKQERKANTQIEKEIEEFQKRYEVKPKVLLTYQRRAYVFKDNPEFRITFDSDLRYKKYDESISYDAQGDYIMDDPKAILLEIKTNKAIPLWLSDLLNEIEVYQAPYSKIGATYLKHLKGEY